MENKRLAERLSGLEERVARLEANATHPVLSDPSDRDTPDDLTPESARVVSDLRGHEEEREYELGQNWFAKVGIVVLALGIVFLLTRPYGELPSAAPGIFGYLLGGGLVLIAHLLRKSFDLVSRYLRGAGMVLFFFATLRLFFFGQVPVLDAASPGGILLLLSVLSCNLTISLRRASPYLFNLTLTTGFATAVAVGAGWFALPLIAILAVISVVVSLRYGWTTVLVYATALAYLTHLIWVLNNPFLGNQIGFVSGPQASLYLLLAYAVIFSIGTLARKEKQKEEIGFIVASFLNGGGSYGVYLLHSAVSFPDSLIGLHLGASALFLALAIVFWLRVSSRFSTFAYVMLGYMALSVAIIRTFAMPDLFVWLSAQSLLVVATAIWFRSRFIIVANFVIYLSIMVAYLVVGGEETGISIGFGIVALASARILNWQKDRLELKTEMMRIAYLMSSFAVFPYAASHLVQQEYVSLAWLGIAGVYYLLSLIVRSQKYRWMGHLTILLTVFYVLFIGMAQLEASYKILSFLVLGTVLLIGSLIFTRIRARRRADDEPEPPD